MSECWTIIRPCCDRSPEGRILPYLKKCAKKNLHYFRKTLCRRCLRELWIYLRSWIYQRSEYGSGSEYGRVLKIREFWIYQGFKYVRVLNMPGFWIYQCSEYTKVAQVSKCAWISLNNSWKCLIISEYACISLNIPTYVWITWLLILTKFIVLRNMR